MLSIRSRPRFCRLVKSKLHLSFNKKSFTKKKLDFYNRNETAHKNPMLCKDILLGQNSSLKFTCYKLSFHSLNFEASDKDIFYTQCYF